METVNDVVVFIIMLLYILLKRKNMLIDLKDHGYHDKLFQLCIQQYIVSLVLEWS